MKVKSRAKNGVAKVKLLAKHPMHTGRAKDADGNLVPAHYIQTLTCEHKGKTVLSADFGTSVSKDPYLAFTIKGAESGDTIKLAWVDNQGETETVQATVG
jgi:sulfur-oxidizing protein SoxZ